MKALFRVVSKRWLAIMAVLIVIGGGIGYYYYRQRIVSAQSQQQTPALQTAQAHTGELVIAATGAGTVVAANEASLAFASGGLLTEVNAQVGDQVKAGDVLARIADVSARESEASAQLQLATAQAELETAQQDHGELLAGASEAEMLNAQASVKTAEEKLAALQAGPTASALGSAQAALTAAQAAYAELVRGADAEEIVRAELELSQAKNSLWAAQSSRDGIAGNKSSSGSQKTGAQAQVANAEIAVQLAEMNLADLKKAATQAEITAAKAKVAQAEETLDELNTDPTEAEIASAQAEIAQAQETLAELRSQPTVKDIATSEAQVKQAQLKVKQAELSLAAAQNDLQETLLTAPFDGTVMDVAAKVGERVGSDALITLADMSQPTLEVYVDETDMDMVAVGYEVEAQFDAMPGQTFKGTVTRIDPELVSVSDTKVVQAVVTLDATSFAKPQTLLLGLNATVDVIGGRAENAVLVPVEALRELDAGEYAVFVVENGVPRLRTVEVGLMDLTYAEILSGVKSGETVSTGMVETQS